VPIRLSYVLENRQILSARCPRFEPPGAAGGGLPQPPARDAELIAPPGVMSPPWRSSRGRVQLRLLRDFVPGQQMGVRAGRGPDLLVYDGYL